MKALKLVKKCLQALTITAIYTTTCLYAVPADQVDWGWTKDGKPTFPNEAYGPHTDVILLNEKGKSDIGNNQLFDVWIPDGKGPFPVFFYAHGGGFSGGDKKDFSELGPRLKKDKVVFVNLNYRLRQGSQRKQYGVTATQDVIVCLKYVIEHHKKYKINTNQIFVGGGSAGGLMMNKITYEKIIPNILGVWGWNMWTDQWVDLSKENMENFNVAVVQAHGQNFPKDKSHSAKDAFEHARNNFLAGGKGMFINAKKDNPLAPFGYEDPYVHVHQIWKDGKWMMGAPDILDKPFMGERFPTIGEWINNIIK